MRNILLLFTFTLFSKFAYANGNEISMACQWTLYGTQTESFVFNLKNKEVYWVNEDKRLPISKINEGLIIFEGTRSTLLVDNKKYISKVKIEFKINRVTGELYIGALEVPKGYQNKCVRTKKVI